MTGRMVTYRRIDTAWLNGVAPRRTEEADETGGSSLPWGQAAWWMPGSSRSRLLSAVTSRRSAWLRALRVARPARVAAWIRAHRSTVSGAYARWSGSREGLFAVHFNLGLASVSANAAVSGVPTGLAVQRVWAAPSPHLVLPGTTVDVVRTGSAMDDICTAFIQVVADQGVALFTARQPVITGAAVD